MRKILIFILLNSLIVHAQSKKQKIFTSGYIVKISGDTVYGKLAILSPEESCDHVEFKNDSVEMVVVFDPKDIIGYKRGMDSYHTKDVVRPKSHIGNKNMFVKIIETGKINVYQYNYFEKNPDMRNNNNPFKSASNETPLNASANFNKLKEDPVIEYYLETHDMFKHITRLNYKGDLWGFFKGDKEMVTKVRKSVYEYESIPQIIREYNQTH